MIQLISKFKITNKSVTNKYLKWLYIVKGKKGVGKK
jgi:hypothetical protein